MATASRILLSIVWIVSHSLSMLLSLFILSISLLALLPLTVAAHPRSVLDPEQSANSLPFEAVEIPQYLLQHIVPNSSAATSFPSAAMRPHHFRKVTEFKTDYSPSSITKYESERTGMSAVVVDREGPKILGFFALATEITDDSGAPHTLEHLCFMGSKNYQYKGVLDKLANRAYSDTNAWTATDHTAYTLETAGWAGFAQILPVYLEHVLLPTLTDAGCYTEVHHIDGSGHDAGVVYSEMQGVQNTQETLMNMEAVRRIYPEGIGFRYETGGMMEALRVLTPERIRQFHRDMYVPKNLCLIVVGEVNHEELLGVMEQVDDMMLPHLSKAAGEKWKRPWVDSRKVPAIKESSVTTVDFPEQDESMGEVMVGFLGPDCTDAISMAALETLDTYLTGSPVSLLERSLVEIEDPFASSVQLYQEERPDTVIWIQLTAVATKKLAAAEQKLFEVLDKAVTEPLDHDYLKDCLRRIKRQKKFAVERSGHYFTSPIIADHLFGPRDGSKLKNLATLRAFDELLEWPEENWKQFIKKWFVDNEHVSILGRPSAKLANKLEEDEKKRVEEQIKKFGPDGLKELQKKLDAAKAENEKEPPKELIGKFKVPGVESIHFIDTTTARAGLAGDEKNNSDNDIQKMIDADKVAMPLYLHYEHIPTNFVHLTVILSTAMIPVELRPLLVVYLENFFSTPVVRNGEKMDYEHVVSQLEKDTVDYDISSAGSIDLREHIRIRFRIEPDKYDAAVSWLKDLMWNSVFDEKRLSVAISKLRSDIPDEKRQGRSMTSSVLHMVAFSPESIGRAQDTLVKSKYLKRLNSLLKKDPQKVVDMFEKFRKNLCTLPNMRVLVVADIPKLKNPVSAWSALVGNDTGSEAKLTPLTRRKDRLSKEGQNPGDIAYVVPLPPIDSSFSAHIAPGPDRMDHPDLPALVLVLAYLDAVEGPLWRAVRGTGLAYGTGFSKNTDAGHLHFTVYRSPDAKKAYNAAREVIAQYMDGRTPFDDQALEGAVSAVVVQFADNEPSMSGAATMSFVNQVIYGMPKDFNAQFLKKVRQVDVPQMKAVLKDWVLPVFDPKRSISVVATSPVKAASILEGFQKDGFNAAIRELRSFEDDYGLEGADEEDDDEEEEEDDDEEGGDYTADNGDDEEEED